MRFLAVSIVFLVLTPSSSWRWSWNGAALKVGGCRRRSCHHSQSKCPSSRGAALLKAGNLSSSYRIGTEKRDATVAPLSRSRSISSVAGATTTSYNPLSLYAQCMAIVVAWISTGTIFYALVNKWPIPQSFFYAVDAGMSIGFCTDVAETKLVSKAFTIVFILLGASVVGGALGLFIQDSLEGIAYGNQLGLGPSKKKRQFSQDYQHLLERDVLGRCDFSHTGTLSFDEFRSVLLATTNSSPTTKTPNIPSEQEINFLWTKFDGLKDGVLHFEEEYKDGSDTVSDLLNSIENTNNSIGTETAPGVFLQVVSILKRLLAPFLTTWQSENRIYFVFVSWVLLGVTWGVTEQDWDVITATHFAISALATGGLTAPPVNGDGILPAEPAIFCGVYCLLGVPLMACTLGHFATSLVSKQIQRLDECALTQPITAADFEVAINLTRTKGNIKTERARYGLNRQQPVLRFGDYAILQLFRQGRLSYNNIKTMRRQFDILDKTKHGALTMDDIENSNVFIED